MLQCLSFNTFPRRWYDAYRKNWKREVAFSPGELSFLTSSVKHNRPLLFVAYNEKLLGHAACKASIHADEAHCQFRILPSFAHRGVETFLLSNLFDIAILEGWTHLLISNLLTATPTPDFFLNSGASFTHDEKLISLQVPNRTSRRETIGSFIDELIVVNTQMWHVQECLYEPDTLDAMSKKEMLHLLHRGTWLNIIRNRAMDNLDTALRRLLLPVVMHQETEDIALNELLKRSEVLSQEFIGANDSMEVHA